MKLALYLPNFRTEVTVKELEDLTQLAEDLDFDSVWTLDRIVVPEASDREAAPALVRHDGGAPQRPARGLHRATGSRASRSSRGSRRRRRRSASG